MSALPPKADIAECDRHVRFVPKADIRVDRYIEKKSRVIVRVSLPKCYRDCHFPSASSRSSPVNKRTRVARDSVPLYNQVEGGRAKAAFRRLQ